MIPRIIKINLDGQREIYSDLVLSVGDTNSYGLILEFCNGGTQFDVTGYNLAIMATRSGSTSPIPDTGIIKNGKGYYTIKPSMYAYDGTTKIEVILSDFTGMFYVTKVIYFVVRSGFSSNGGEIASETDYTILSTLIAQTQAAISSANGAAEYALSLKYNRGVQYTIAASNAIGAERADLILTGTNDGAAINAAFTSLAALRASDDVAVRVDFLGGDITVEETIIIPHNFRVYGNGVRLTAITGLYMGAIKIGRECYVFLDGIIFIGNISCTLLVHKGENSTVTNCKFYDGLFCIANEGTMSITNCSFSNSSNAIESADMDLGSQMIRIYNCRFSNAYVMVEHTATISDCEFSNILTAIRISEGAYSSIIGNRFTNSVTTPIDDQGTSTLLANNITEV